MSKKRNNLFLIFWISTSLLLKPISYDEMRSRHSMDPQEIQFVRNESSLETKKRKCSILEDFFFSGPDELELLEKSDEIILPRIIDFSMDSTEGVKFISSKKDDNKLDLKTKTQLGTNSIFVEGFQAIRTFPAHPKLNYYDQVEGRTVKPALMLQAHLTCMKEFDKLPREIGKKDKTVKFDKKFSGLFKKNYEVFGYNLYLEENLSKDASNNKIKQGKQNLFKKYGENSKEYLRTYLFENPCIIKSEKCRYLNTSDFVTIYYDQFTNLFAIVDSKSNCLLDFGIATKVKYAEIFASKSFRTLKTRGLQNLKS